MSTLTLRSSKGSPLTNNEVDNNFSTLNTDKLEAEDVTFEALDANGDVGEGASQVARGSHTHQPLPVGFVMISTSLTNPATLLGYGTWVQIAQGRTIIGEGTGGGGTYTNTATGGSKDAILVSHTHGLNNHTHTMNHNHPATDTTAAGGHSHDLTVKNSDDGAGGLVTGSVGAIDQGISTGTVADHQHSLDLPEYTGSTGAASGVTEPSGNSGTDANMMPYLVCYIWERTG